ncbi:hypothetical protein ACFWY9_08630 [Amycolatopsis sp. NPDC059027]|uniref:hypothetical protein n=1 Tax=unclassified Amycolatopsis TaxID=2618356 RepID=UPI003672A92A
MFVISTRAMYPWIAEVAGNAVTFRRAPEADQAHPEYRLPRVWSGHGLAMPEADLPGFAMALAEVMRSPNYWNARAAQDDPRVNDTELWSEPWYDVDDEFVYISGPCGQAGADPGYRPGRAFAISLPHVRGLRVRVAAYVRAHGGLRPVARTH